jgi:hypothetical protein
MSGPSAGLYWASKVVGNVAIKDVREHIPKKFEHFMAFLVPRKDY